MSNSKDTDQLWNTKFTPVTIGEHNCNVNRTDLKLLINFSDAVPHFSDEFGPHLQICPKNDKPIIVPLNGSVANGMLIKDGDKMSDSEYYNKFVELKKPVVETLIKNTYAKGYEFPSIVQALAIPELIQRKDALIQFKSGTGKTHAFLFGLLWGYDPNDPKLQYIFITNSHEVAKQIYDQAKYLYPDNAKISLCIGQKKETNVPGGFKNTINTSSLSSNTNDTWNIAAKPKTLKEEWNEVSQAQIIIGTMGKLYDYLCNKKWMDTKYVKAICVDEFDNIIASRSKSKNSTSMSTEEQMYAIVKQMPKNTQRVFFSATVSEQSLNIANSYFRDFAPSIGEPFIVLLDTEDYTLEGIRQYYVEVESIQDKKDVLLDLLKQCRIAQGIIFTNQIRTALEIKNMLDGQDIHMISAVFHGELPAIERNRIHKEFLDNKIRILISTDITARGFDAQSINLVLNFDMPDMLQTYIHRVGRSGRYGRKGVAISLIQVNQKQNEMEKVKAINDVSKLSKMEPLRGNLDNLL